jgi:HD-GYP domain-containing protein (c-di-GMP phosphodiesterase class II)
VSTPPATPGVAYLLDTIRSLEKRSACLLEVARFVREVHDFHELLGRILAKAAELVGADAGVIALADADSGEFRFVNVHYASLPALEAGRKEKALQELRLKLTDGVIGQVHASGEPRLVADVGAAPAARKDVADSVQYEVRNLLAVPLAVDGDKLGALEFLNKVPDGAFTELDLDLASAMAAQIALVVEAHRLRESAGPSPEEKASPAKAEALEKERDALKESLAAAEKKRVEAEAALQAGRDKEKDASSATKAGQAAEAALRRELEEARGKAEEAEKALRKELEEARRKAAEAEESLKKAKESSQGKGDETEKLKSELEEARKKLEAAAQEIKAVREDRDDVRKKERTWSELKDSLAEVAKEETARRKAAEEALNDARQRAARAEEKVAHQATDLDTAFRLHEKTRRQVDELTAALEEKRRNEARPQAHQAALMRAFSAVSSNQPLDLILETLLSAVAELLEAEAASLLLTDEETGRLYFAAATGLKKDPLKKVLLNEGEGIAGWVAKNGRILNIPDVARDPRFSDQADKSSDFKTRSILAVPLFSDSQLIGVAEAVNKKDGSDFSQEDGERLIAMSLYGAMVIRKSQIYHDMNELFLSTVRALADAIETKGAGGKGRADRVRKLVLALARELALPEAAGRDLEIAALLHDVGKVILPEDLLRPGEELTEPQAKLLARAPVVAAEILSPARPLKDVVPMVRHVQERWDGLGHPDKLKGEAIPMGSRVIAVAATFEAMTADGPYRRRLPEEVAVKEIQTLKGAQLDPAAVEALVRLYRKGRLKDLFK